MLQLFRKFFSSRVGALVALAFLGLIALAFASSDVANTGTFGGVAGGDRVATVGKQRIDSSALSQAATSALENIRQQNPSASMPAFLASNGLDGVLDQIIARTAIGEFGRTHGIIAGDRLIDSEIAKMPAFQGVDGRFSETAFRQAMQQRGLNEALVRSDLAQGLVAQQLIIPASIGAVMPQEVASRYAALLTESRKGAVAVLPARAFAPATAPTDAELQAFYSKNQSRFIRPERRVVRYASFGDEALKTVVAPTDAEIAARYDRDKAQYAASEKRTVTQLIVPTEAAARAVLSEVGGGKSLDVVAREKGLAAASLGSLARADLSRQTSPAIAQSVFAAARGTIAEPARSGLGWHVLRVDAIAQQPERPLAAVRGEISAALAVEKRRAALTDLTARIEEEFDNGGNLADAAKELGLAVQQTAAITADGREYADPAKSAPPVLARALQTAFSMESEGKPQIAEVEPGKTFLIFDVSQISQSAPAPLAEIKEDVTAAYMLSRGSTAAKAAADQVLAAVRKGTPLAGALASLNKPLPPVQPIAMSRQQLAQVQSPPAPLALLFAMAKGTAKPLAMRGDQGWYIVALDDVIPRQIAANDPMIAGVQRELSQAVGDEYADQLTAAIRSEVGVKRNPTAIEAVRKQLTGGN